MARALTDAPGNHLTPAIFKSIASSLAERENFTCKVWNKPTLRKIGAGAFLSVADSTPSPAYVIRLRKRSKDRPRMRLALIGKGICFDTGGYNIKPGSGMRGMHGDMAGAAVALGAACVLSNMNLPIEIECWLGLAENHISPAAARPGDVVRSHLGKTIELVDTDAEGRLVLADLLSLATHRKVNPPDVAVTFATLTGTMTYALGQRYSGLFATNPKHADIALKAGCKAGERLCRFPMDEDYHAELESKVADLLQCSRGRYADHIMAARFLGEFVAPKSSWLHIDLSAATAPDGLGAISSSTTGFGVRWAVTLAQALLEGETDA